MEKEKEKPSRSRSRISFFRYASFVFPTQPYSPTGRDRHVVSIVPEAARHKKSDEETDEPTSPKVTCIGQIKHQKHRCKSTRKLSVPPQSAILRLFQRKVKPSRDSVAGASKEKPVERAAAPPLGQMKRFASGREGLAGFDWREKVYDDDDDDDDGGEEPIVPHSAPIAMGGGAAVTATASKEVNLWKRRMASKPELLHLS